MKYDYDAMIELVTNATPSTPEEHKNRDACLAELLKLKEEDNQDEM